MERGEISGHDLLVLSLIPGVGPARLRALVNHFGCTGAILHAAARDLVAVEGIEQKTALGIAGFLRNGIPDAAWQFAADQLSRVGATGSRFISFWDDDYPANLRRIYDPPPFLFVRGELLETDHASIAVVGTRNPTPNGVRLAELFTRELAGMGICVVSGLARGIDTLVHASALKAGGRTLAVIGSGLDVMYPPENSVLAARVSQQGAMISEFLMGAKPDAVNFPQRNRIISGITIGTLVIESGVEGGAMITARTALDQGREVFAIPSPADGSTRSGTNLLIREGSALLTEGIEDILGELGGRLRGSGISIPAQPQKPAIALSLFEQKVFDVLTDRPVHIDALAEQSGYATAEALVHLLTLEFKGAIRQLPGKLFMRA